MTSNDRQTIRELQDKLIKQWEREGFGDSDKVGLRDSNNHDITISDMKKYIYPQFENTFKEYVYS
jgi:hypothetical protein